MVRPINIAHRGGAGLMPENTLAAFADAIARGCDGAELDVQLSSDGVAVVHHDFRLMADVARVDGVWLSEPGSRIKDLTAAQLGQVDVGRPCPASPYSYAHPQLTAADGQGIPTLASVVALAAAQSDFCLMVELKSDTSEDSADPTALADAAYDVVRDADFLGRTIFVGFDWRALLAVKGIDPSAACWFTTDRLMGEPRAAIEIVAAAGADGWFPHFQDATPENIALARTQGLRMGAWTVNAPEDMARLWNLDALCTDRPDLLKDLQSP